jgi:hypothetical protein
VNELAFQRPNLFLLNQAFDLLNQLGCYLDIMDRLGVLGHLIQQILRVFGLDLVVTIETGVATTQVFHNFPP